MSKFIGSTIALAVASIALPALSQTHVAGIGQAQTVEVNFVEDTGAAIRIEAGDKLRIVSQEIPAAACHLSNGVSTDRSAEILAEGVRKFDAVLDALQNGNPDYGIIGQEEHPRTARMLEKLAEAWAPFRAAALKIQTNPTDTAALALIYDDASAMLERTSIILAELEGVYSNPVELLYSDTMLLEVSGRQAMLTQRLSYLACRKWSGAADDAYIELLRTAAGQYNFAMQAMLNGAPELGVNPPPTDEIATALQTVSDDSDLIQEKLSLLFETGTLDQERAADLYDILADKMYKMEEIAHLYALYSKRVY